MGAFGRWIPRCSVPRSRRSLRPVTSLLSSISAKANLNLLENHRNGARSNRNVRHIRLDRGGTRTPRQYYIYHLMLSCGPIFLTGASLLIPQVWVSLRSRPILQPRRVQDPYLALLRCSASVCAALEINAAATRRSGLVKLHSSSLRFYCTWKCPKVVERSSQGR